MAVCTKAVFALVASFVCTIASENQAFFTLKENYRREHGVFARPVGATSLVSCGLSCLRNPRCVATNFRNSKTKQDCELLDFEPSDVSSGLKYEEDWVFTQNLKGDCHFNPCSHGGSCEYKASDDQFVCSCPPLWRGDRCQLLKEAAIFNFTPLGHRGRNGPTDNQGYKGTVLENTNVINGTQIWTVPVTGDYHVTACGAAGGDGRRPYKGGRGALVNGTVFLKQGNVFRILVGQQGETPSSTSVGAGGGGTFIFNAFEGKMLAIAGGGGGGGKDNDGGAGRGESCGIGNGGKVCAEKGAALSGGGGGFSSDGMCYESNPCVNKAVCAQGGRSYKSGGAGGISTQITPNCDGGFGGGGACSDYPGGGGGYSGGGVWVIINNSTDIAVSSKGGCSTAPDDWERMTGYNDGNGYVIFKLLSSP